MIYRSLQLWGSHIPIIAAIMLLAALLTGFCEAWLWHNYVLTPNPVPLVDAFFPSASAAINYIIIVPKLLLGIVALNCIMYSFRSGQEQEGAISSMMAGTISCLRCLGLFAIAGVIAWGPYVIGGIVGGGASWAVFWGIAATFYFFSKYILALPVMVFENQGLVFSLRKAARLSRGIKAELLLLMIGVFMLAEIAGLVLSFFILPAMTQVHDIWQLALASTGIYFLRWFLYTPILVFIYAYYRKQLAGFFRLSLFV